MFYVIGENNHSSFATGEGETIEDAICNWASCTGMAGAIDEFNDYLPKVVQGKQVAIKMEYSFSIIEN